MTAALLLVCLILAPLQAPAVASQRPVARTTAPGRFIRGTASWFATGPDGLYGAAGPALRRFLGPKWRGMRVRVCAASCIVLTLDDWCACPRRLIDLSDQAFRRLAPLSRGLVSVRVGP